MKKKQHSLKGIGNFLVVFFAALDVTRVKTEESRVRSHAPQEAGFAILVALWCTSAAPETKRGEAR